MSTDLAGVRILAIDRPARRVHLRVFIVYYDTSGGGHEPLPYDASFFCRALSAASRWEGTGGGLADAASVEQWCDEAWVNANAWRLVERWEEITTRNHPVTDYSELSDFFYERQGRWVDEEKLVQGDYDVWLSEEKWLDGLVLGASFGTTAYCTPSDMGDIAWAPRLPEPQRRLAAVPLFGPLKKGADSPSVAALSLSDDDRWLAAVSSDGRIALVDTTTWGPPRVIASGEGQSDAEFAEGEPRLLLRDGRSVQADGGKLVGKKQRVPTARLRAGVRTGPVRLEVTVTDDEARLHVFVGDQPPLVLPDFDPDFAQYALSADGSRVAYSMHKKLQLWDTATRTLVHEFEMPSWSTSLSFSPDGALLLATFFSINECGVFEVYEVASGKRVRRVSSPLAESPDPYGRPRPALLDRAVWGPGWVAFVTQLIGPLPEGTSLHTDLHVLACGEPPPLPGNPEPASQSTDEEPLTIDAALARSTASGAPSMTSQQLAEARAAHDRFLAAAPFDRAAHLEQLYPDDLWQVHSDDGLPLVFWNDDDPEVPEGAERATFRLANLAQASLAGASLALADFTGAHAPGADLAGADLFGAAMTDAVFTGANLAGADLRAADLSRSDLRGANLRGANLESTDLAGADLTGADLTGARIGGIKLRHATVDGVRGFGEP